MITFTKSITLSALFLLLSPSLPLSAQFPRFYYNHSLPSAPIPAPVKQRFTRSAATQTPSATIYVTTPQGIQLLSADPNGVLTASAAPPRQLTGNLVGILPAPTYALITLDSESVYFYALNSDGTIGTVSSSADTANYYGAECGLPVGASLDQPRGFVYVQLAGATDAAGDNICDALQTYRVDTQGGDSQGTITFVGGTIFDNSRFADPNAAPFSLATLYGFNMTPIEDACEDDFNTFSRETSGAVNYVSNPPPAYFPQPDPTGGGFFPLLATADSTNHLAVAMFQDFAPPCGVTSGISLASFSVADNGELSSTNTFENMPPTGNDVAALQFDPTGTVLAVAGDGLLLYHFNGAQPITAFPGGNLLPGAGVSSIGFDNAGHLYAWGIDVDGAFKVFPFTISAQGVVTAGSPLTVSGSTGMAVEAQ